MRIVLQRVNKASVSIDDIEYSSIHLGYLLLVGVEDSDGEDEIEYLIRKISNLRIFEDSDKKMNLNIKQVNGEILSVSQFTLYADTKHGNRPSFVKAGKPSYAEKIYNDFNQKLLETGITVKTGVFGADMTVQIENNGPCTIIFDTDNK
ncbi:D-aminoacyl-tRNA deacylase [Apilactobacillus xinyiensis]|uniref:D-aminoacyl-tRNA deacylase n=1 Tax=Apilactobacillus xinyiensis TaxID=2841032 RepID=A0ABT0HZP4_9LACO|nr:D-aminoacyl-tRNA deacylase [Apilactobacillus xinyiensis]MCK8624048.1 D-tyrosyl-tRNA(Tyr) deacylase [Apilactobacillus xinyiensis]MCL0311640.1 D-aminoacyl-tRNA deacylase [Apilactobacillus xinyiensis]MCL0318215.1 D-aminoacyl-tRNA deacylase [Apilactobacillus xinyiensis]MCL0329326.1 D-aminoacyl-tRNA deacylase [Apilactobacillus xinyiensis]